MQFSDLHLDLDDSSSEDESLFVRSNTTAPFAGLSLPSPLNQIQLPQLPGSGMLGEHPDETVSSLLEQLRSQNPIPAAPPTEIDLPWIFTLGCFIGFFLGPMSLFPMFVAGVFFHESWFQSLGIIAGVLINLIMSWVI